jgi:hypothetical protein
LYDHFDSRRVNKINSKRNFFWASFDEISLAIEEVHQKTEMVKNLITEEENPATPEYNQSLNQNQK